MKCVICLKVKKENPKLTNRELFLRGEVEDAVAIVNGNGYCEDHLPEEKILKEAGVEIN